VDEIELSLVIPTYNERENVGPLVGQVADALGAISWEIVFVDDSTDGTDDVIAALSAHDARVRLLHRLENRGGLAGAVVDGLTAARGTYVCVLDADLQHPPSRIPTLLEEAHRSDADLVIASRYLPGGSAGGLAGPMRRAISTGLKGLSKLTFPQRLARVTDPLGGYFLLRRALVDRVDLRPIGYKILLEILVRCDWRRVSEVPYAFQPRLAGASKADLPQGLRFLRHLATLAWDCSPLFAPVRVHVPATDHAVEPPAALSVQDR
jgi:dolichol-phosphate mannosyltransferase